LTTFTVSSFAILNLNDIDEELKMLFLEGRYGRTWRNEGMIFDSLKHIKMDKNKTLSAVGQLK